MDEEKIEETGKRAGNKRKVVAPKGLRVTNEQLA